MTDQELVKAAQALAEMIFALVSTRQNDERWVENYRTIRVNPNFGQTASGLCLQVTRLKVPAAILTPWGNWYCFGIGGGNWGEAIDGLLKACEAKQVANAGGDLIFGINRVESLILPEPKMRELRDYLDANKMRAAWKALVT